MNEKCVLELEWGTNSSIGDKWSGIKSLTILIPSRLDLIVDYGTIMIPTTILSPRSRFQSNFDQFLIKVDHFRSLFDWKINQSQFKDRKSQLKDQNYQLKDQKCQYILKKLIYFEFFDHFQSILISFQSLFDLFLISFQSLFSLFSISFDWFWTFQLNLDSF